MIKFSKKIIHYLKPLYKEKAEYIKSELEAHAQAFHIGEDSINYKDWYKGMRLYTVYPDGVIYDKSVSPLRNLIAHLSFIKKIHCNAVYLLPFFESPMVDKGFDVSDYYKIKKEFGTMMDIIDFKVAADKAKIHRFIDLILNHVSDQHEWFKRAQLGDEYYRNYFIYSKDPPQFIRKINKESSVVAEYDVEGKKIVLDISFPELVGKFPHWRQGDDGYWYYHSYCPQQIDLNWLNADVFIEFGKILIYWASLGFNFRLDAIPFVGKKAYKTIGYNVETHFIVAALKCISEKVHPYSVMLVETYEKLPTIMQYFGTTARQQANLAYNFHLCTYSWISLIKKDVSFVWSMLNKQKKIPHHAQWLNFLRNHDELSLAHLTAEITKEMQTALLKFGKSFREGHGVSGRTFSFLGGNPARFRMAYFLAASFPGSFMVTYGDEIAAKNIPLRNLHKEKRKDTRNINRGVLTRKYFQSAQAKKFINYFSLLFKKRAQCIDYFNKWPKRVAASKNIYAAGHHHGDKKLFVYVNLSSKPQVIVQNLDGFVPVMTVNKVQHARGKTILGGYAGIWLTVSPK